MAISYTSMTPPPRGEVFALLVLAGSIATAKTQDPVAAALAADEALLAPATESTHSMPCQEHFERFVIQNVTNHTCPPASGPCAMLSVQRWGCTCKDCISEGGAVNRNCAVPARCARNVTDEKTGRTSLSVGVLQYYEFRVGEASDITSANRANTVAEVFRLFRIHQSERSGNISTMLAGTQSPSGSRARLGETVGTRPSVHPDWVSCSGDYGAGPTSCCSCTLDARGLPNGAVETRTTRKRRVTSCTTDPPNNDQYCLDMSVPAGCKQIGLAEINDLLQEAGFCPSPVPRPPGLEQYTSVFYHYDRKTAGLTCVDYKMRTWLRTFSECSSTNGWGLDWKSELDAPCGVDVPGLDTSGPEFKPSTADWIPSPKTCGGWCNNAKLSGIAWCQKCIWQGCAACPQCANVVFKPPIFRTMLDGGGKRGPWGKMVVSGVLSEAPEPNLHIDELWTGPNSNLHVPTTNSYRIAFKDRHNVMYLKFGAQWTSWPPFHSAMVAMVCPTEIRTVVGVKPGGDGCIELHHQSHQPAGYKSSLCQNMGPGWCCSGIGPNRTNCKVTHNMVDAKWREIVSEMRSAVSQKAWRCGCSNGRPDLLKCYEDSAGTSEFCASCFANHTLHGNTCVHNSTMPVQQ